jgi:hypothetical protein
MKEAAQTWGDESQYYLKAAMQFADAFDHWGGFSQLSEDEKTDIEDYRKRADREDYHILSERAGVVSD